MAINMWCQIMFLRRAAGITQEQFVSRWPEITDAIVNSDGPKPRKIVANHPLSAAEQKVCDALFPATYDGVYEFWFYSEREAVEATLRLNSNPDLRALTDGWIETDGSAQWLAEVRTRIDLPGTVVRMILAGKTAEEYSVEQAQQYWHDVHPVVYLAEKDFAEYITGYVQNHARDRPILRGLDLFWRYDFNPLWGHLSLRSVEDVVAAFTLPSYVGPIRADEAIFGQPLGARAFVSTRAGAPNNPGAIRLKVIQCA